MLKVQQKHYHEVDSPSSVLLTVPYRAKCHSVPVFDFFVCACPFFYFLDLLVGCDIPDIPLCTECTDCDERVPNHDSP